ncbi:MAG: glycosyl hydrolase, partial [Kiritimatiellia bacterium]|nr:glycosyl hydrolase [Kiritimatiellia bacterium]
MKKGFLKRFNQVQFAKPDAFYWPGYMWFWNDCLSKKNISSQIKDMHSHQAKNVWPIPEPQGFRPNCMPTLLEPDYLSEEYLKIYRYMVKEAHRSGMKVWLNDEGGWPSGMVCGRLVRNNPRLAQQSLERKEINPARGGKAVIPEDCLSAFLYQGKKLIQQLTPGKEEKINIDRGRIEIFSVNKINPEIIKSRKPTDAQTFYPDLLNPESTREFIRMTHEIFKKAVGDYFGNTISLVFSDEATVANPPWTPGLVSDFKKKYGYDIREKLPDIFRPDQPDGMQTRVDFYDWWSQRFADAFWEQIQKWCRKNNLFFAGHLAGDGDGGTMGVRRYGFGHPLRILRKLDIPGVDAIWRQIFPDKKTATNFTWKKSTTRYPINVNHYFPKYASTVAHQEGKPWVITESFCVYGAGLTPAQMKWITDFQYVRGANIMTMGGYQLSTKEYFMGGERPLFGRKTSLWPYMDIYHTYTARISYLLSLGKPAIETAVYYPVRDLWAGGPEVNNIAQSHDTLIRLLLENQCDFDLVDDDVLERNSAKVTKGRLQVGPMNYHTICVSRTRWMNEKSKEKLSQFISEGGKVLWVDDSKNTDRPDGVIDLKLSELERHLIPLVQVEPNNGAVRVCKRKLANGNLYFITNESLQATEATLKFTESLPPIQIDPESGACHKPSTASYSKGTWSILLDLKFAGSAIVFFTREKLALAPEPLKTNKVLLNLKSGWACRRRRSYLIGKHDLEVKELDERTFPVKPGDWRERFGKDFSGDAEYLVNFECDRDIVEKAIFLDLGKVNYVCRVSLNNKRLGKKAWQPFRFLVKNILRPGRNELKVIVTNTMANQYVTTRRFDQYPANVIGPYHKIALNFEKESLPSGLYGPVRIYSL